MNAREIQEFKDEQKPEEALIQSSDNIEKPKQTKKSSTKTAKKETKKTPTKKKKQTVQQEYYYEPSFSEKVIEFLSEKWYVILCAVGLIIANFVIPAMYKTLNEDPLQRFVGTYTFSDDINHRFIVTVKEGGDAIVKMDRSSVGDSYIEQAAWGKAMRGIKCVWDTIYASKGGRSIESISVEGDGVEFFFCDGYAYLDYYDFSKMRNGKRYSFEK